MLVIDVDGLLEFVNKVLTSPQVSVSVAQVVVILAQVIPLSG
jgi:hypothetical protein